MNKLKYLALLVVLITPSIHAAIFEVIGLRDGMQEVEMPADGNCLFWSVAAGANLIEGLPLSHKLAEKQKQLRVQIANKYKHGEFDEELRTVLASDENPFYDKRSYIKAISEHYFGGELEILAMSKILGKNIVHHMQDENLITYPDGAPYNESIHIWYTGNHYNLLTAMRET